MPNRPYRKKSKPLSKLKCIITIIVLIPIIYGVYLHSSEFTSRKPTITTIITATPPLSKYTHLEIPQTITLRKEQIIHHTGYVVSYNESRRLPNWVGYELTRQETQGVAKRNNRFVADPQATGVIATNGDYAHSGYDKGHMAPAADMKWNSTVMAESFYFSNMCPQHPDLNRRKWKDLEQKVREWAIKDSAIVIICGPIMNKYPSTIGKNQIAIPEKFFKVILSPYTSTPKAIGFLFENKRSVAPLHTYIVTVDSLESLTGMDFFAPLPDELENRIESHVDTVQWGI